MQAVTEKVKAQSQTCRNSLVSFSAFFFALPPCRQQVSAVQNAMLSTGFPSQLRKSPQQVFTWHALTALGCPYTLLGTWGTAGVHHGDRAILSTDLWLIPARCAALHKALISLFTCS